MLIIRVMSKILQFLSDIHKDKLLHFFYASILSAICININIAWGSVFCVFVFAVKEIVYDGFLEKGEMSWGDFFYGLLPLSLTILTKIL